MYESLMAIMSSTLAEVTKVKESFSTPKTKLDKFPCVFYKPYGLQNAFETNQENMATYRFLMVVMVGASGTTIQTAFGTILPSVVDDIVAKFNEKWNGGTINTHRVWVKIDSADAWEVSEEQDGLVAYAPLYVEFKLVTNI